METIMRYRPTRIIPACAGSTLGCWTAPCCRGDHPRLRGEHVRGVLRLCIYQGSSPLARGARVAEVAEALRHGIIPACAGSTKCQKHVSRVIRDHPRLRGEHKRKT